MTDLDLVTARVTRALGAAAAQPAFWEFGAASLHALRDAFAAEGFPLFDPVVRSAFADPADAPPATVDFDALVADVEALDSEWGTGAAMDFVTPLGPISVVPLMGLGEPGLLQVIVGDTGLPVLDMRQPLAIAA
jgi:hypothetical protein